MCNDTAQQKNVSVYSPVTATNSMVFFLQELTVTSVRDEQCFKNLYAAGDRQLYCRSRVFYCCGI